MDGLIENGPCIGRRDLGDRSNQAAPNHDVHLLPPYHKLANLQDGLFLKFHPAGSDPATTCQKSSLQMPSIQPWTQGPLS